MAKVEKKQMNYAIEMWRFICCMSFILVHVYSVYPRLYWHTSPWFINDAAGVPTKNIMFTGSLDVIVIFYLITGYFLMKTFKKNQAAEIESGKKESSAKAAGKYFLRRLKGLYPTFLIATAIGFVLTNIGNGYPIAQWPKIAVECIWEWLGCAATGLGIGNNTYGLLTDGRHMLMNNALWFISGLLIISYIIYYLLHKYEENMISLVFPVGFICAYGYFHTHGIRPMWFNFPLPGVSDAMIQAFFTIGLGCVFYVLIEGIKDKDVSLAGRIALTIVNLLCSGIVVYHMIWGTTFTFATINGLCVIFVFLTLWNKDYLTKILNVSIWKFPGKISLYFYMLHFPIVAATKQITQLDVSSLSNLHKVCLIAYLSTTVLSLLLMLLMEKVINPWLNKKVAS